MNKRRVKRSNHSTLEHSKELAGEASQRPSPFENLEKFLHDEPLANFDGRCCCKVCRVHRPLPPREQLHYMTKRRHSTCVLRDLVESLVVPGRKSMKLYLPDICFFDQNVLTSFYCTNHKDQRVRQPYPILTEKLLEGILRRHRNLYDESMKLLFERNIQSDSKFGELHEKYATTVLPTHFYEGMPAGVNSRNIHEEKRLVVHRSNDTKLQLPVIVSGGPVHTDNQQYVVQYADGNMQMLAEDQFEAFMSNRRNHGEMLYIKSYVKPKEAEEYTHEYRAEAVRNEDRWHHADILAGILNEQINVYDERYLSEEFFDEELEQLKDRPQEFLEVQVYRMVCYLSQVAKRRTTYLRSRWVLNDLGNYYLNDILQWDWERVPLPELPPLVAKEHNPLLDSILNDEVLFLETFKQTSRSKHKPGQEPGTLRLKLPIRAAKQMRSMSTIDETTLDTHGSVRYDTNASRTLEPVDARQRGHMYSLSRRLPKKKNYQLQPLRFSEAERSKQLPSITLPRNTLK